MNKKFNYGTIFRLAFALVIIFSLILTSCAPPTTSVPETNAPGPTSSVSETKAPEPTSAVSIQPTAPSNQPKLLKARLYADFQVLDPAFYVSSNDTMLLATLYSGLVSYCPNSYDICNDLAEKIETSEDGTVITFKLREGVQFTNGYGELTTEDVKYSYERFIDPELNASYADDWSQLDHVEIIDKYNGKIILKGPFAPLWHSTLPVTSGLVLCKKYVEEVGLDYLATHPVGSGPYYLAEWKPKQETILKRNPDYYGSQPYYDEIHLFPIEDDKTAEIALEAGELDFSEVSIEGLDLFSSNPNFETIKVPNIFYNWVGMNVENPKLADINVRLAIRYGIDVDSILAATYFGKEEREYALIAPGLTGYWEDAPRYDRDVEKAKEYMAKAGLTSLDLRMDIQNTTEYVSWAQIVQQNLKEIGINITINPMDTASFWSLGSGDKGKEAEIFGMMYSNEPDPMYATVWWTTPQIGIWNWMRWSNAEYDELYKKGMETLDEVERDKIYERMQQLMDDDAIAIWITHGSYTYAWKPGVIPALTPHGIIQIRFFSGTP